MSEYFHFQKWCNAYHHYIDEWYDKFIYLYNQHGYFWNPTASQEQQTVPSKKEFYEFCYRNTRKYPDPGTKKNLPHIVLTPRKEEDMMKIEQHFFESV